MNKQDNNKQEKKYSESWEFVKNALVILVLGSVVVVVGVLLFTW